MENQDKDKKEIVSENVKGWLGMLGGLLILGFIFFYIYMLSHSNW